MINSNFDPASGFLVSIYSGDVTLEEIIEYIDNTKNNNTLPRKLKIISDSTKATMLLNPEDLYSIVEANNQSLEKYDEIIDAIVVDQPKVAAVTYLFKEVSKNSKYKFQIFSTMQEAEKWLKNQ